MKRATGAVLFVLILLGAAAVLWQGGRTGPISALYAEPAGSRQISDAAPSTGPSDLKSHSAREERPVVNDQGEIKLRLMTYNIHHGEGTDGKLDLNRISGIISGSGADIVALQEVDKKLSSRSMWQDQPAKLAQSLDMNVEYAAALERFSINLTGRGYYGNALLSKYPIVYSEKHVMPRIGTDEDRAFLHSVIDLGQKKLHVVVTHLGLDPIERQAHIAQIIGFMNTLPSPKILMGDFNAEPDSPELAIASQSLRDTVAMAGDPEQFTLEFREPPIGVPNVRIDYIFVSPDVEVLETYTPTSQASDHLPVVATVSIDVGRN